MWTSPLLRRMRAWRRDTFRSVKRIVLPSLRPIVISSRSRGTTVVFPSSSWITSLNIVGLRPRGLALPERPRSLVVPVQASVKQLSHRLLATASEAPAERAVRRWPAVDPRPVAQLWHRSWGSRHYRCGPLQRSLRERTQGPAHPGLFPLIQAGYHWEYSIGPWSA